MFVPFFCFAGPSPRLESRFRFGESEIMLEEIVFSWWGKEQARSQAQAPPKASLRFLPDESVSRAESPNSEPANSGHEPPRLDELLKGNCFIEGDNLEALKILLPVFKERIKMIYIDPPYNTGKDFVYPDDFSYRKNKNLTFPSVRAKQEGEDEAPPSIHRVSSHKESHAIWLNMILPRLILARKLLSSNGAIFISIDETEAACLKLLGNEIFGESNFVGSLIWLTTKGAQGIPRRQMLVPNHEYILCWAKDGALFRFRGVERSEDGFSNPDNDPRGLWKRQYVQRFGQGFHERTIVDPQTGKSYSFESPYTEEKLNNWIQEGRIVFPAQDGYPMRKEFLDEYKNRKQITSFLGLFPTKANTEQLNRLFEGQRVFESPKPLDLIRFLIDCTCEKDDTILDFFAGSGTTGHATLELNARDEGARRFILVEKAQPCGKKSQAARYGWESTAQICRERLRRAWQRIADKFLTKNFCIEHQLLKKHAANSQKAEVNAITPKSNESQNMCDQINVEQASDSSGKIKYNLSGFCCFKLEE